MDRIDVHLQVEKNLLEAWKGNDIREQDEESKANAEGKGKGRAKPLENPQCDQQNAQDAAEVDVTRNLHIQERMLRTYDQMKQEEGIAEELRRERAAVR